MDVMGGACAQGCCGVNRASGVPLWQAIVTVLRHSTCHICMVHIHPLAFWLDQRLTADDQRDAASGRGRVSRLTAACHARRLAGSCSRSWTRFLRHSSPPFRALPERLMLRCVELEPIGSAGVLLPPPAKLLSVLP